MATDKRSTSELVFRIPGSKEYDALRATLEDNEELRNCRLMVTTGTVATSDNWNVKANSKNKNSRNNGAGSDSASGIMEWTFKNATISALTVIGTDGSGAAGTAGATPEVLVEGTIVAQNFIFVSKEVRLIRTHEVDGYCREGALLGEGILKGLAETARNFVGSFFSPERLTTVEYPEQRIAPFEAARVFPFLVYDGENRDGGWPEWEGGLRCVACQICEKECPPKCIYIEKSKDKKLDYLGKAQYYPSRFDIDISVCMSCQICVEVCPFEAIKMDTEFELSTDDRFGGLLLDREQLAKSNEYYRKIHPTEAAGVDARLAADKIKADVKAKGLADAAAAKAAAVTTQIVEHPDGAGD
ncbi:MAG: 4Fe-4S dicluster domain-containing protein [Terracidiphilus sp.]|jgi:NADH-quinone oxidoreductase subunit I